jgi:hypothetical protein
MRKGRLVVDWFPMAKRVTNLYRYAQVCLSANTQYIEALAVIDDPTEGYKVLHRASNALRGENKSARALNFLNPDDSALCGAVMCGEQTINGFRLGDIADYLGVAQCSDPRQRIRERARLGRRLKLLHVHGLIRKIPHSRRYRATHTGTQIMTAAVYLYKNHMPRLLFDKAV